MKKLIALLVLSSCAATTDDPDAYVGRDHTAFVAAPVPLEAAAPGTLVLSIPPTVIAGSSLGIEVDGAFPYETIALGRGAGQGPGPCGAIIGGQCLDLLLPAKRLSDIPTDDTGYGELWVTVPDQPGTSGCFQAVAIRNHVDAELSPVVCTTIITDSGDPTPLLLTDSSTDMIYLMGTDGTVSDSFASPVSGVQGVAHDRGDGAGFWVMGSSDLTNAYKLDWSGALVSTVPLGTTPREIRGLDYWVDDYGEDLIVVTGVNVNSIDVVWGFLETSGTRWIESGFYSGGFMSGLWGVHVTAMPSDFDRWTSWYSSDTLELWLGSSVQDTVTPISIGEPRGMTMASDGTFYVVDAANALVVHLDAGGAALDSFATPASQPAGLSYME